MSPPTSRLLALVIVGALTLGGAPRTTGGAELRLARFSADVTIPLGHRCMGILPTKASAIVDPLQVHGFVLLGDEAPIVLAAFDWCEIRNDAYDAWRDTLAAAADTTRERVLVCSLHQHDAPVIDSGAQRLLDEVGLAGELFDTAFHDDCLRRVGQALRDSLDDTEPVTHLGIGVGRVDRVASNRRVVHLDGRVSFDRYSSGGGADFYADADAGLIDPMLKTISLWNGDQPLIAINHYAVHPMSYYGRGGVSYDFVGMARERQRRESGVPQIYVSGCSGDVVAGKFNDGSADRRQELATRLQAGMQRAWEATERLPIEGVAFRNQPFELPFHESDEFSTAAMQKTLRDPQAEISERILAAMGLSSRMRMEAGRKIDLPCVDLGPAQIVLLPGEAFVGYQVMAQQMRPDSLVMPIGYGECWPGYIPTAAAFADNFDHGWRWAGPHSEEAIRAALREVLGPTSSDLEQSGEWQQISLPTELRERCLRIVSDGLRDENFWSAVRAAKALIRSGNPADAEPWLRSQLEGERDDQRRSGLARELARGGDMRCVTILLEILADDGSTGRTRAAEGLYELGEIGDGVALREALAEAEDAELRLMACAALADQGSPRAWQTLRRSLDADDPRQVQSAARVLGRIGGAGDRLALKEARERVSDAAAIAAIDHALAALGDSQGTEHLVENLSAAEPAQRIAAAEVAGEARITSAAPGLVDQLSSEDRGVRISAAEALLMLALPSADRDESFSQVIFEATDANPRYSEGSILQLADGSLLFAVTEFKHSSSDFAEAQIVARQSRDGGRTWDAQRVLQPNADGTTVMSVTLRRLGPPNRWDTPIGMFYLVKTSPDDLDVFLRISRDEAQSFGEPIQLNTEPGYHVMNNDRVTRLASGRLLAPVAFTKDVHRENHFVSFCLISDDNGQTWHRGSGAVDAPGRGAMEPETVELADGRVMMIARTQMGHIAAAHSDDGGETWGEPFALSVAAPESPATIRRLPATGDLVLIWNNHYAADQGHGGTRTPLTAAVSSDEGKTWDHVRNIETRSDRSYAYTSMLLAGGRAILSYWQQDLSAPRYSARFRSMPVRAFYAEEALGAP